MKTFSKNSKTSEASISLFLKIVLQISIIDNLSSFHLISLILWLLTGMTFTANRMRTKTFKY